MIVDDNAFSRDTLATLLLRRMGQNVLQAEHGKIALDILASPKGAAVKLIILDLNMPVMGGMETLAVLKEQYPHIAVIILTGANEPETVVLAMKNGAMDFIAKPWQGDRIIVTIGNALKLGSLHQEVSLLRRKEKGELTFIDIIGHDKGLTDAVHSARKAASSNIPVLLCGETGVGKEIFARAIHGESMRAGKPFIAVNCGAIPPNLIESTLFGHEKGAFTGAIAKAPGKFREAEGGTLFLDEIGELPLEAQTRLLRALQQKEVEPVGSSRSFPADVRVISATNKNLAADVKDGRFREDLFFRLDVLRILLPPLRERRDDIPDLAAYFLSRFSAEGKNRHVLHEKTLAYLQKQSWPGNVRELENALYRAVVLAEHTLLMPENFQAQGEEALPKIVDEFTFTMRNQTGFKTLADIEDEITHKLMIHFKGNVTEVAKTLGIPKSTFYRKLHKQKTHSPE